MSSGSWAGAGAARYARSLGSGRAAFRPVTGAGGAGLRPAGGPGSAAGSGEARELVRLVQEQVLPYDKNYLRHGSVLAGSLGSLDEVWAQLRSLRGEGAGLVKVRQAAAMTAHARWMYASALARTESRGMARRLDHPGQDPAQHHRIVTGGLDRVWTRPAELVA
ncbi:hypothetical protein ACODT5_12520 [Streptomyces sp. 5.8]|uniref:hypothetical protein n=1 Tax=Streptomyces sp. 5.8 TaxID=3406571 RepID=UPI003BB60276